ncbi:DUF2935 domain-containing protein [Halobacillus seohaensis]|uniref:DUF2935 domain-containing protein n=1 Tax=Halobacillus seohaensis TaxID=447421 RepID=A0ABW2EKS6_9BACI
MRTYEEAFTFEHQFWLQVLGDHARFIRDALYPSEKESIERAKQYVNQWDHYLERARSGAIGGDMITFTHEVGSLVREFHKFKLAILEQILFGKIKIHFTPTFINHMVNEIEEYLLVIGYLGKGQIPPIFHELHHHMLWLLDASGHATAINDQLDGVEQRLKQKSHLFSEHFNQFYLKAVELTGYLRTNHKSFPSLSRYNDEVEMEMKIFKTFLHELEEMELNETLLGSFSALMADHMAREECYYLFKIAESTGGEYPSCDPTKPRVET